MFQCRTKTFRLAGLLVCFLLLTSALAWHISPARALPSDYPTDPTSDI